MAVLNLMDRMRMEAGFPPLKRQNKDGGPGSGNFGHAGVPGQVGGSAPGKKCASSVQSKTSAIDAGKRKTMTEKAAALRKESAEIADFQAHINSKVKGYDPQPFIDSEKRQHAIKDEAKELLQELPAGTLFTRGCTLYEKKDDGKWRVNDGTREWQVSGDTAASEFCGYGDDTDYPPIEFIEKTDDAKMVQQITPQSTETYSKWAADLNGKERKDLVKQAKKDPAFKELVDAAVLYTEGGYVEQRQLCEQLVRDGLSEVSAKTVGEYANGNLYKFRDLYKGQDLKRSESSMAAGMVHLTEAVNASDPYDAPLFRVTQDRGIIKTDSDRVYVPPKEGDRIRIDAPTSFTASKDVEAELSKGKMGDIIHYELDKGATALNVAQLSRYKQEEYLTCGEFEVVSVQSKTRRVPLYHEPTKAEQLRGVEEDEWGKYTFYYEITVKIRQVGKTEFAKHEDAEHTYAICEGHFEDRMVPEAPEEEVNEDGGPGSGNHGHAGVPGQRGGSAPGSGSRTAVNGSDITKSYSGKTDLKSILKAQGFDGLPKVVSKKDFDDAVKACSFIAQRTYSASSQEVLDAYRDQLYNGDFYVEGGEARYGQGMYCASSESGEVTDEMRQVMEHYKTAGETKSIDTMAMWEKSQAKKAELQENNPEEYEAASKMPYTEFARKYLGVNPVSYTETMTLDPSAKTISIEELQSMKLPLRDQARLDYPRATALAALLGYDAVRIESRNFTVILNRTKTIILDERGQQDAKDSGAIFFQVGKDGVTYAIRDREVIGWISTGMSDGNSSENSLDNADPCDTMNMQLHGDDFKGHKGRPGQRGGSLPQLASGAVTDAIKEGTISTKLDRSAQSKHKKGSASYREAVQNGQRVSYFTIDDDELEKIVKRMAGTGIGYGKNGQFKEVIDTGKVVGVHAPKSGDDTETTRITVHYGKRGCHAVPAKPKK